MILPCAYVDVDVCHKIGGPWLKELQYWAALGDGFGQSDHHLQHHTSPTAGVGVVIMTSSHQLHVTCHHKSRLAARLYSTLDTRQT